MNFFFLQNIYFSNLTVLLLLSPERRSSQEGRDWTWCPGSDDVSWFTCMCSNRRQALKSARPFLGIMFSRSWRVCSEAYRVRYHKTVSWVFPVHGWWRYTRKLQQYLTQFPSHIPTKHCLPCSPLPTPGSYHWATLASGFQLQHLFRTVFPKVRAKSCLNNFVFSQISYGMHLNSVTHFTSLTNLPWIT